MCWILTKLGKNVVNYPTSKLLKFEGGTPYFRHFSQFEKLMFPDLGASENANKCEKSSTFIIKLRDVFSLVLRVFNQPFKQRFAFCFLLFGYRLFSCTWTNRVFVVFYSYLFLFNKHSPYPILVHSSKVVFYSF